MRTGALIGLTLAAVGLFASEGWAGGRQTPRGPQAPSQSPPPSPPPLVITLTIEPPTVHGGKPLQGAVTLGAEVPPQYRAVLSFVSTHPAVAPAPSAATLQPRQSKHTFTIATTAVAAQTRVELTAKVALELAGMTVKRGEQKAQLTVLAPTLRGLACPGDSIVGGASGACRVELTGRLAPGAHADVTLRSSNPELGAVPASVTVPGGADSASFSVQTKAVASLTKVTIDTAYQGVTAQWTPSITPPEIKAFALDRSSVEGGQSITGRFTLTGPAPSAGAPVHFTSNTPGVAPTPEPVTVPAGEWRGVFSLTTKRVTSPTVVTISASLYDRSTAPPAALTVQPRP